MRLHYLHLPRYGPLRKLRCVFQQNTLLPGRVGAVNFVVGVNGTGKSSLLRALYHTFQCLEQDEPPPFPISLAYTKKTASAGDLLVVLDCPPDRTKSRLQLWSLSEQSGPAVTGYDTGRWERAIAAMRAGETTEPPLGFQLEADIPREQWTGNNAVDAAMPSRVVTYTSGDPRPWQRLSEPEFDDTEIASDWAKEDEHENERPPCWSPRDERRKQVEAMHETLLDAVMTYLAECEPDAGIEALPVAEKLDAMRQVAKQNRELMKTDEHRPYVTPASTLLNAADLRLAGVAVGVWNACEELRERVTEEERTAFLKLLRQSPEKREDAKDTAGRLFNALNWAWPTHLILRVNPAAEPPAREEDNLARILTLHGLTATVLRQPLGRLQLVIPLGPRGNARTLDEVLKTLQLKHAAVDEYAARVDTSATGAEAVVRLFNKNREPWPLFEALKAWRESGWLEDATLTVLRTAPRREGDAEDNAVHCLEDFSDGESELLGRTALLFLLKKQVNAFLLLDEPETHFNDAWKREVVDFVDDHLLKTTPCQVLVSTHSAIALTDVFREEIFALQNDPETSEPQERILHEPTFGAAPGDIMRRVFGAADTVGRRAMEFLDEILVLAAYPEELAAVWPKLTDGSALAQTREFTALCSQLVRHPQVFGSNPEARLVEPLLRELRKLTGPEGQPAEALEKLAENVGAGHYRFEFARRLAAFPHR